MDKVFFAKKTFFFVYCAMLSCLLCVFVKVFVMMCLCLGGGVLLGKDSKSVKKLGKVDSIFFLQNNFNWGIF